MPTTEFWRRFWRMKGLGMEPSPTSSDYPEAKHFTLTGLKPNTIYRINAEGEAEEVPPTSSEGKRWTINAHGYICEDDGSLARGPFPEQVVDASEVERLRSGIEDYLLWEPGRRGHAEAHRRLAALLHPTKESN